MAPPPTPDDSARQRAAAPPWPVVVVALAIGLLLVPATTLGGYLLVSGQDPKLATAVATAVAPTSVPNVRPAPSGNWQVQLRAPRCEASCIGGSACISKPVDCTSGLTCIPGHGDDRFGDDEMWSLHLSAVLESPAGTVVVDPCQTGNNFWVCRSGTTICASQADACANAGRSAAAIPVTGAELAHQGLSLEVRLDSGSGPLVAKTETIIDLRRGGLCKGFSAKAVGGNVRRLTYFILPP